MYLAHVMGVPVEETLVPLVASVGCSLIAVKIGLKLWLKKCRCKGDCKCVQ